MDNENSKPKQNRWAKKRKARNRSKEKTYQNTVRKRLFEMFEEGTYRTYKKQLGYFIEWLEKEHPKALTIDDAYKYANDYLLYLIDKGDVSASTIATRKSAMAKVFGVSSTVFIDTPERTRLDIKRSRFPVKSDKHISEATERRLARFTSATGLRRAEMTRITSDDLFFEDGKAYLDVTKGTKGGKARIVEIMGASEEETEDIVKFIQSKKGRIFPKLHTNYDNHHYRGTYAMRLYMHYERNEKDIPRADRYVMRKDRAGETYDKRAMAIVTKNLGHNRIDVIAQSYLYQ
ncbi:phage integrase N-terminal SAM-like domain-containing protein [Listeria monocytogenes]|nr:phage integrase N-terminal SAM-like domain-containing protein [Listeria monocytogenes]